MALIGVSHRRGGAAALEAWQTTFTEEVLAGLGFVEYVAIVTCNRWDLTVVLPEEVSLDEARRLLTPAGQAARPYAYAEDGALEQITRIAASLDSLNPGEDQIMAQVREAFGAAQRAGTTGPRTSFTFNTALRIAKKVRREVALAPLNTSLFSLARPELEKRLPRHARVAVVGAGEMGTLAAKTMASRADTDLIIVNRTFERAQQMAKHLSNPNNQVSSLSLTDFLAQPPDVDALICATPVKDLVDETLLEKLPNLTIAVDLGIPRNVKRSAANTRDLFVLNVDTLQSASRGRRGELAEKFAEAEGIVQRELGVALTNWTERQLGPSIKRLREMYLATIGDSLPKEDAEKLAHKFAHVPIKGLRAVAREHGLEAAKTFLTETGLGETGRRE